MLDYHKSVYAIHLQEQFGTRQPSTHEKYITVHRTTFISLGNDTHAFVSSVSNSTKITPLSHAECQLTRYLVVYITFKNFTEQKESFTKNGKQKETMN